MIPPDPWQRLLAQRPAARAEVPAEPPPDFSRRVVRRWLRSTEAAETDWWSVLGLRTALATVAVAAALVALNARAWVDLDQKLADAVLLDPTASYADSPL